jgi:hypothetical protein
MLSSYDIEVLCDKLELPLVGVYSKDKLPKEREVGSYYINLQNDADGDGTHWVLAKIYCDKEREENKVREEKDLICNALYFDPFGISPPIEVVEFLKPFKPIAINTKQIQSINTSQCGWYCVLCDYTLEHQKYFPTYERDYKAFINSWSSNPIENLANLKNRFKKL